MKLPFLLVLLALISVSAKKYKPVILLHGIITSNESMVEIRDRILEVDLGVFPYFCYKFNFRNIRALSYTTVAVLAVGLVWKTCGIKYNSLVTIY